MPPRWSDAARAVLLAAGIVALPGCGKRGDPLPPRHLTPLPPTALSAAQRGASLVVSYQAPRAFNDGSRLPVLEVELWRADREGEPTAVGTATRRQVAPGELVVDTQPLPTPGTTLRFAARARVKKALSVLASAPALVVVPPPPPPHELAVQPGVRGLELSWTAPAGLTAPSFWVYRRHSQDRYGRPLSETPLADSHYADTSAAQGEEWCYVVRSVLSSEPVVESAPSQEACALSHDVTPPAAPQGAAVLEDEGGPVLSWSPSPEADLAHYRVYRIRRGQPELLVELPATETRWPVPADARGGAYVIHAVDQAGNESPPSTTLAGTP